MSGFSLRARIMLGAVLWSTGLFAVLGVIMTQIIYRHPSAPTFSAEPNSTTP